MESGRYYPVAAAVERVTGYRPSNSTCRRWELFGVLGPNGRVRLRTTKVGGRNMATEDAVIEFVNATNRKTSSTESTCQERDQKKLAEDYLDCEFSQGTNSKFSQKGGEGLT